MMWKQIFQAAALPAVLFVAQGCKCDCPCNCEEQKKGADSTQKVQAKPETTPTAEQKAELQAILPQTLPEPAKGEFLPCERIFTVRVPGANDHLVLGADGDLLWAAKPDGELLWRVRGQGSAQHMVAGGDKLYVAWGEGFKTRDAPFVLTSHEFEYGHIVKELYRRTGERTEAADLQYAEGPGVKWGEGELYLSVFTSKYMVELHRFNAKGEALPVLPEIRMATSWKFADFDSDGVQDAFVGRVYGDAIGVEGDLKLATKFETSDPAQAWSGAKLIPTENGVRALALGQLSKSEPVLFVSDGWMANYGKLARANLAVVPFTKGEPKIEYLSRTDEEFSYFEIHPIDLEDDGTDEIVARGNKYASLFSKTANGWQKRVLTSVGPVSNSAVGRNKDGSYVLYLPNASGARAIKIEK